MALFANTTKCLWSLYRGKVEIQYIRNKKIVARVCFEIK